MTDTTVERWLQWLRQNWGDAYEFFWRDGKYWAERSDNHTTLSADTAFELRDLVAKDYTAHPVPREERA